MRRKKRHADKVKMSNKIFAGITIILSVILLLMVTILNIIPLKYLAILYIVMGIFDVVTTFLLLKKNSKIGFALATIFIIITLVGIRYLNTTYNLLSYFNKDNYKMEKYLVVVLENSNYEKLEDLNEAEMGYVANEMTGIKKALDKVNKKVNVENVSYEDYTRVFDDMLEKKLSSSLIEESSYNFLLEENEKYVGKFKVIDEIKIITKIDNKSGNVNVTKNTFNVLISGIDTAGDISSVGRSDVNMVLTINPKTKQVLMTSIPRDYYVQLHNTTGYKDKLTHAGLYGVDMSVATIEELLDIDINYYFRVNFSTLEKVIDALNGVDVYSKYSFVSYIGNYQFYKGYNHMNGNQALGFARERKTLPQGDISRAENQQAVIDGIIRKLTSFNSITKYSSVINSLENTFQTNMSNKDITSLMKMQLNDHAKWNVTSNVLKGTGVSNYTYSYKGQKLYVMEPDMVSVREAKSLITDVINGKLLDSSYSDFNGNVKNPNKVYKEDANNSKPSNDNKNNNKNNNDKVVPPDNSYDKEEDDNTIEDNPDNSVNNDNDVVKPPVDNGNDSNNNTDNSTDNSGDNSNNNSSNTDKTDDNTIKEQE